MSPTGRTERNVVLPSVEVHSLMQLVIRRFHRGNGVRLHPELGVEVEELALVPHFPEAPSTPAPVGLVVDVVPQRADRTAEGRVLSVLEGHERPAEKRHREIGVETPGGTHARIHCGQRTAVLPDAAVARPEELPDGHLHGRRLLAVPEAP